MYDITDRASFERVREWVGEIKKYNDRALYIIVGNKCDLEEFRTVVTSEGQSLADELGALGFFECSSKLDLNVKETVRAIIGAIYARVQDNPTRRAAPTVTRSDSSNKMCNLL
jgi:GTPase SAR1 family protein